MKILFNFITTLTSFDFFVEKTFILNRPLYREESCPAFSPKSVNSIGGGVPASPPGVPFSSLSSSMLEIAKASKLLREIC